MEPTKETTAAALPFPLWLVVVMLIFVFPAGIVMLIINAVHEEEENSAKQRQQTATFSLPLQPVANTAAIQNTEAPANSSEIKYSALPNGYRDVLDCKSCGYTNQVIVGVVSACEYCQCAQIVHADPAVAAALNSPPLKKSGGIGATIKNALGALENFLDDL